MPSTPRLRVGRSGERVAADYLTARGHQVIATNVRRREGEIDLITLDRGTLVFVEVKLRRSRVTGEAVEAISVTKGRRLVALAAAYAAEHPELPAELRIDLVAIDVGRDGSPAIVRHIESAVEDE
jgi:putative endonuclease